MYSEVDLSLDEAECLVIERTSLIDLFRAADMWGDIDGEIELSDGRKYRYWVRRVPD